MALLLLLVGVAFCGLAALALRPPADAPKTVFLAVLVTAELAPTWLAADALLTTALAAAGALDRTAGLVGLAAAALGAAGLLRVVALAHRTPAVLHAAGLPPAGGPPLAGRIVTRDVVYAEVAGVPLHLDVYRPAADPVPERLRPGVLYLHGGSLLDGDKRSQGGPLLRRLVAAGWVGLNANYRLSPQVAFPTQLADCKRAIAWYRAHAREFGADPDFLCVTGGSAGALLAALVALTPDDPRYQPGFEEVDTSVRAAVTLHGVYDVTDARETWRPLWLRRLEQQIMQVPLDRDPGAYTAASPVHRVHAAAPPFLVLHGAEDCLVPASGARRFADRLRAVSAEPVAYAELSGAQHMFDVFPSRRTAAVTDAITAFVDLQHRRYLGREVE
ncbi:alpha/beta hydrolase [Kitasatospora sp. NPDC049285]|uniref:alpha/beta hydrolase n=1 Tax=Kitasatospora sp. NPDC049285 TaxID=3157096 RepID=UPI003438B0A7